MKSLVLLSFGLLSVAISTLAEPLRGAHAITKIVNTAVVIDTETLRRVYSKPSLDPKNPTALPHNYSFLIAPKEFVEKGQGTADLEIKAKPGDVLRWYGTSETTNFETSVLVYDLTYEGCKDCLSTPEKNVHQGKCVFPKDQDITKIMQSNCNYLSIGVHVKKPGTVNFHVRFAVFKATRDEEKDGEKKLHGYFDWDPIITIK